MSESYDDNNIFAKILRGEIPSFKVYEDADTLAFMDVMPQSAGHTLKIAVAAKKAFAADGIQIGQFNEPASGQTVYHLHFHIIPRFDGVALKPHTGKMEDMEVLKANAEKLKAAI
ncbi:unnamed protein product [Victoria cruziana]